MKFKSWHFGLIAAALVILYLIIFSNREALTNPPGCPTTPLGVMSLKDLGGGKIRLYTKSECDSLKGGKWTGNGVIWGMPNNNVGECADPGNINYGYCNLGVAPSTPASAPAPAPAPAAAAPKPATPAPAASGCPKGGQGITSVKDLGGGKIRLYTKGECDGLGGSWTGNGVNWGMANGNVGECQNRTTGMNFSFCNQSVAPSAAAKTASTASATPAAAKPADKLVCPASAPGITSIKASAGQRVRLYTQSECTGLKGRWTGNGKVTWGMANDKVGECLGVPTGGNVGFCNRDKPASTAAKNILAPPPAAKPAAPAAKPGAPAAKPLPSPVAYSGSGTGASLTCNTFPVYYGNFGGGGGGGNEGMVSGFPRKNSSPAGWNSSSGGWSNSPAVWNVVQPPSGWNSKTGFMS